MATLEQRVAALEAILSGDVYQSAFDGAVIDSSVGRAKPGGELDSKISELDGKVLSHAERHSSSGSDPITPSSIGAAAAVHAAQHRSAGSDPVTPADIGAVSKTGDTMTGELQIISGNALSFHASDADWNSSPWFYLMRQNHGLELTVRNKGLNRLFYFNDNTEALKDALTLWYYDDGSEHKVTFLHTGNLSDYVSDRSKVVEYTGTGTKSVSVAVGFVPKLVVVQQVLSVSSSSLPATLPLVFNGVGQAMGLYKNSGSGNLEGFEINVTAFGETVSWNGTDYVEVNNNLKTTYRVTAIG